MKQYTNEEIREFIKCPQFGDIEYGKWGALRLDVRQTLLNLININDSMDYIIKQQYQELQRKDNNWNVLKEFILNHYIVGHTVQNGSLDMIINKMKELENDN